MKTKHAKQLSVEEAAYALGVTPRSVINYIRSRDIEANKVGKSWHISKPSLDAFKQRFGFVEGHVPVLPPDLPTEPKPTESTHTASEAKKEGEREKREIYPVHGLKLFQIAKETLLRIDASSLFPENRPDLLKKFMTLKTEALENLGAGFYSFGNRSKAILYNRSREKIGGMLSLVYFYQVKDAKPSKEILKIEEELMPAYSSLIRRMEKKSEKKS